MDAPKIFNSIRFSVNQKNFKPKCAACGSERLTIHVSPKLDTAYQANVYTLCTCGHEENYVIDRHRERVCEKSV